MVKLFKPYKCKTFCSLYGIVLTYSWQGCHCLAHPVYIWSIVTTSRKELTERLSYYYRRSEEYDCVWGVSSADYTAAYEVSDHCDGRYGVTFQSSRQILCTVPILRSRLRRRPISSTYCVEFPWRRFFFAPPPSHLMSSFSTQSLNF